MYASSVLTSSTSPPGKEMISNQTSCFEVALSGCSIITINVLLEIIGRTSGVKIPEFHRASGSEEPGMITSVRLHEAGATICEEVTSNLLCHTVYPLEISEFCTPAVFDSWLHRIQECATLKLKSYGCKIETASDVTRCGGLKGNITQCIKEMGDTPCRQMKVKVFNVAVPLLISVPKDFQPLVKGNKEHIRKAIQDCLNTLEEDAVNKCVPNLYDALVSIATENAAYRPTSLKSERYSGCLKPLFENCNLLSRDSLERHIMKEFNVYVNLTFGDVNVKWFSEVTSGSGKVTVFGVTDIPGMKSRHPVKKACSPQMYSEWKDSLTKCLSAFVIDLGMHDPHALTLKRNIDETNKCIIKDGALPCHLDTRSDYENLLTYLLDLIRHNTVLNMDYGKSQNTISSAKRMGGHHAEDSDKTCHDSLKYENIKQCGDNIYMYLTHLEATPDSAEALARENEKNQECLSHSLKDCSKPVITGIMSFCMGAVGHHARETRDVLGAEPYRHKRLVSIQPMYGGVVTVCEEATRAMPSGTPPMYVPDIIHRHTGRHPGPNTEPPISSIPERNIIPVVLSTEKPFTTPTTEGRTADTVVRMTKPLRITFPSTEATEEFTDTETEPTSSPQCSEKEVELWMAKAKKCSHMRLFQLFRAFPEDCLQIESSAIFGNVSLCVSEMKPLMSHCGHERFYVFESILEHLQKMIQQLKAEAVQKCKNTNFCLPDKPQLVKCAGPFYDHMKEMKDTGKNYEHSLDLRSMKDIDQCLTAEMAKCRDQERRMFQEIVFITYGVEIPETLKQVSGERAYCYTYTPPETAVTGVKTPDIRTKTECTKHDADRWLSRIRQCLERRIAQLRKKSLKSKAVSSDQIFRYVELCIHVHRVLHCKPMKPEVFEPLFRDMLSNVKQDLMKLEETLKSQSIDVRDAVGCTQQLDGENMQNCIPALFKDMNYLYSNSSAKMKGLPSEHCIANALNKCSPKTLEEIDYVMKSGMGILRPDEKYHPGQNGPINICRPIKAVDIGYRVCTSNDLHTELQQISFCLDAYVRNSGQTSLTLERGIVETAKCVKEHMKHICYFDDPRLLKRMVEYIFTVMGSSLQKYLSPEDAQCLKQITGSNVQKCTAECYAYIDSLKEGQIVGAMSLAQQVAKCMLQSLKGCSYIVIYTVTQTLGNIGRVNLLIPPSGNPRSKTDIKVYRIDRDANDEPEEYESAFLLENNPPEESSETANTLIETELHEEMEDSLVRKVRELADDSDTTLETLRDDIPTDETAKEGQNADYAADVNVTKTDLLTQEECNATTFSRWLNSYHECFVAAKYRDSGTDLNNIIKRILASTAECVKYSEGKRCFPSWTQIEEFLEKVVSQAKDYAEMYLSEIRQGREDIVDLPCIENLSFNSYKNCTSNIHKFLDCLRNRLVSPSGFEEHIERTAVCLRYSHEDCSKMASTKLIEVVEELLDLRNGTIGKRSVMIYDKEENIPHKSKSIGEKIVDFFKDVAKTIAKPFVWLYGKIKSFFNW